MEVHLPARQGMKSLQPAAFPVEIQRGPVGADGVSYVLPCRPAHVRREGLFIQIVALVMLLVLSGGAITMGGACAAEGFRGGDAATGCIGLAFVLGGLVFGYLLVGLFLGGWLMRAGHCEIEVVQGRLRTTERVGFLRLSQTAFLEQVVRLIVEPCDMTRQGRPVLEGTRTELAGLRIELNGSSPLHAAAAYPRPWIEALAYELQALCASYRRETPALADGSAVPVEEELQDTPDHFVQREITEQPRSSPVLVDWLSGGGIALHVPPVGLRKEGNGRFLFWFGLAWFGFALLAPAAWLVFAMWGAQLPPLILAVNGVGMLLALGVGFASLLAGINMARRRASLAVTDGWLLIVQTSLFGSKRGEWGREEIATIGIGYSGLNVQGVPAVELQVQLIAGERFRILAGRDRTELDWIATTLRRELQLPPPGESHTARQS